VKGTFVIAKNFRRKLALKTASRSSAGKLETRNRRCRSIDHLSGSGYAQYIMFVLNSLNTSCSWIGDNKDKLLLIGYCLFGIVV